MRKLAEGQPCTAFGLMFGDKEKGDWLQEGFRYIYPFDYEVRMISTRCILCLTSVHGLLEQDY